MVDWLSNHASKLAVNATFNFLIIWHAKWKNMCSGGKKHCSKPRNTMFKEHWISCIKHTSSHPHWWSIGIQCKDFRCSSCTAKCSTWGQSCNSACASMLNKVLLLVHCWRHSSLFFAFPVHTATAGERLPEPVPVLPYLHFKCFQPAHYCVHSAVQHTQFTHLRCVDSLSPQPRVCTGEEHKKKK